MIAHKGKGNKDEGRLFLGSNIIPNLIMNAGRELRRKETGDCVLRPPGHD